MRIVQLIDSLEAGGAERMAVNLANALSKKIEFSGIIATRFEGSLKHTIEKSVHYWFLNKTKTIDIKAIRSLFHYCKTNNIDIIHAHSSSFFLATIIKFLRPKTKIVWHNHFGNSELLSFKKVLIIKICSIHFYGIISVNKKLDLWANKKLNCKKTIYLQNFVLFSENSFVKTKLYGENRKRIISIANLREEKNHFLLINVFKKIHQKHPNWTLHLVGKDFKDSYSKKIKQQISENYLNEIIYIYDSISDIDNVLNQSEIAVLSSNFEGLPVSLLEYGMNKKPVIVTAVGEIPNIIKNNVNGFLVPPKNTDLFADQLIKLIENPDLRNQFGAALFETIANDFSEEKIIEKYLEWLA